MSDVIKTVVGLLSACLLQVALATTVGGAVHGVVGIFALLA